MEQAAVRIVALKLDFQRRGKVEWLGGGDEPGLDIVGLLGHGHGADLLQLGPILVLDLLLVVVDEGLLLDVAIVIHGAHLALPVLEAAHLLARSVGILCLVCVRACVVFVSADEPPIGMDEKEEKKRDRKEKEVDPRRRWMWEWTLKWAGGGGRWWAVDVQWWGVWEDFLPIVRSPHAPNEASQKIPNSKFFTSFCLGFGLPIADYRFLFHVPRSD